MAASEVVVLLWLLCTKDLSKAELGERQQFLLEQLILLENSLGYHCFSRKGPKAGSCA